MEKKTRLRIWVLAVVTAVLLGLSVLPVSAATDPARCGAKLYWSYDPDTGNLAITGTGAMFSYATGNAPWLAYRDEIRSVTFESGITTISDRAFYGCTALESAKLPDSVTSIGESAFEGCVSLRELPLGGGAATVGAYAFRDCRSLTQLNIPQGPVSLGDGAFRNCTGATALALPASVQSLGQTVFQGCAGLETIAVDPANTACRAAGNCLITSDGTLVLGCKTSVLPTDGSVTAIGADAFRDCESLTELDIPNSVTAIGDYAFLGCRNLTRLNLGSALQTVGVGAFQGCTGLTEVTFPQSLTDLGACAFSGCGNLATADLPNALRSLGSWAFADTAVSRVYLPDSVSHVGVNPFRGCRNLVSITSGYRAQGYRAQGNCLIATSDRRLITGCSTSVIPASVQVLGRECFRDMGITQLTLSDSVTTIQAQAFAQSDLVSIHLGAGLADLADNPLASCQSLKNITLSEKNPNFRVQDNCLIAGTTVVAGTRQSRIPEGITAIGTEAFRGIALQEVTMPQGVTRIGKRAFFGCGSLKMAVLPNSLEHIGESAFELSALTYLEMGALPQIDSCAFLGCYGLTRISTPDADSLTPGSTQKGYIAYYVKDLTETPAPLVLHYTESGIAGIYDTLEAAHKKTGGWLRLRGDRSEDLVLTHDLTLDLAGFDLSGTLDTAGYRVLGFDSTTDTYEDVAYGSFYCLTPDGAPVVPERHMRLGTKRYLTVSEGTGYSFHRFYLGLTHTNLRPASDGLGYKAAVFGDSAVMEQLVSFSYTLCLEGHTPVTNSTQTVVSAKPITLRLENFQANTYGETPLTCQVALTLTDGTVLTSAVHTTTLRENVEHFNSHMEDYTAAQIRALADMIGRFPVMATWQVENILGY